MNSTQASMRARLPQGAAPRQRQRGISLLFLLFIGVLLVIVGGAALKLTPTFIEYRKIQAAIDNSLGARISSLERSMASRWSVLIMKNGYPWPALSAWSWLIVARPIKKPLMHGR